MPAPSVLRRLAALAALIAVVTGAAAAQPDAPPAAARVAQPVSPPEPVMPLSATARLRGRELARLQQEAERGPSDPHGAAPQARIQAAVNESPGDRRTFWNYNFTTDTYEQVTASLRITSPRGLYFVADGQSVSDEQLNQLVPRWESIYTTTTQMYGEAPDVDRDSKVTLLLTELKMPPEIAHEASFDFRHQSLDFVYSNNREMIALDARKFEGMGDAALGQLAHELALMINWNYHRTNAGQELWLLEGLGELARFRNNY
ncbi:MAG: hypothetical protein NTZ05_18040, partial [Chloroflexi bacterium]|nr:hypothetical protein [Chloroflexota bacterium]